MSGIVGMLALRGASCDLRWLQAALALLAQRGPDAQHLWHQGCIGFGHALLRTTHAALTEEQPCTLDERLWITADVRLDNRDELRTRLQVHGQHPAPQATDPLLLLHAYRAWGERCVDYLLGDFAFLLWDQPRQRLFCARDHLGVKPLYYATSPDALLFSNTLACLRLHASVSNTLHEPAIGDYLLFGHNQARDTTIFTDIRGLPPAHTMTWEDGRWSSRRYWQLAEAIGHIRYRQEDDYVAAFRERLDAAVQDRVRTNAVGVAMSGGLDSTALAAMSCKGAKAGASAVNVQAYTIVYKDLIPDTELPYAQAAARALQIPQHLLEADTYPLLAGDVAAVPQPDNLALLPNGHILLRCAAAQSRVLLNGHGGDEIFAPASQYLLSLVRQGKLLQALREGLAAWRVHGACPLGLRRAWGRRRYKQAFLASYPPWLNDDFAQRCHLRQRWQEYIEGLTTPQHPVRPESSMLLGRAVWSAIFSGHDPGVTRVPIEVRYPFLDLRVLSFALSIPPFVWCIRKHLLRQAMRGILPPLVVQRSKQGLRIDPVVANLQQANNQWVDTFQPCDLLQAYVKRRCIPPLYQSQASHTVWLHIRPLMLDLWLCHQYN